MVADGTPRQTKFHGRTDSGRACAVPGCREPGEFRAPGAAPGDFDGPGEWLYFCLDHVRAHNAAYNYFDGMTAEEIYRAQHPLSGWDRETRAFAHGGADRPPKWSDFADPIDAIGARFKDGMRTARGEAPGTRFSAAERRALDVLGLNQHADLRALRQNYSMLVRRYHPDRNGGDRSHEARLQHVIEAYQLLKRSSAFI